MILHLDKTFNPFPKERGIRYKHFIFSGGEPHINILESVGDEVTITHRIQSFNDLGILLIAVNALRNMFVTKINLFMPYFPAARQDRIMVRGEALSVKVYADLINSLKLNRITIFDPHSEVTPALLNNCVVLENHQFIKEVIKSIDKNTLLISPDAGALKKIYKLAYHLQDYKVIECSKIRDIATRKLSKFKVYADDLQGVSCLIVDDICDGGRTFIGLAKELKNKNAGKLYLAVSHGIFSRGLKELNEHFEKVFTTDAFRNKEKEVVQIKLEKIIQ